MPQVVGVQFQPVTKIYYFDPGDYTDLLPGEWVIVDTARGREMVQVVHPAKEVDPEELGGELKPVLRRATLRDHEQRAYWSSLEDKAMQVVKRKAVEHGLKMKVVRCRYAFNGRRLVVEYTAEKRVDFRALVKDLAQHFATRIEMRQIGVRDQAKLVGGYGKCGRALCCASFLREFHSVSIKMAKNQNLPLNPADISGSCGRLLCSLAYENAMYAEARKHLPKLGQLVETPEGVGHVRQINILMEQVTVEFPTGSRLQWPASSLHPIGRPEERYGGYWDDPPAN
ncbi:MAG: stage 0 sporulation family protein [Chloroflexi bacterium]|nr:stage 0 sporulation family protein [Chloroflexota bacterium]